MSSAWWIRVSIILLSLFWAGYTLTPTFLAESASDRLTLQAEEAKGAAEGKETESAKIKKDIKERIPAATELPLWLQKNIQADVFDCKTSCKEYEGSPQSEDSQRIQKYYMKGKSDREGCARERLGFEIQNGCAVGALKKCVSSCSSSTHSMKECAEGCLYVHNNEGDAPSWVATKADWAKEIAQRTESPIFSKEERAKLDVFSTEQIWQKAFYFSFYANVSKETLYSTLYSALVKECLKEDIENREKCIDSFKDKNKEIADKDFKNCRMALIEGKEDSESCIFAFTVKKSFETCLVAASVEERDSEACVNRQVNTCTSQCRKGGEEALPTWVKATIAFYPSARLSLGLDLQGGIDMDLRVQIEEAVSSNVQRDVDSMMDLARIGNIVISESIRLRGEPVMLILSSDGSDGREPSTKEQINSFINKRLTIDNNIPKYSTGESYSKKGKEYMVFRIKPDVAESIAQRSIEQALETLRSRIDETGVKEPSITKKSDGKINIQLPGISDVEQAMSAIGTSAVLKFMMVDEDQMEQMRDLETAVFEAKGSMEEKAFLDDELLSDFLLENEKLPTSTKMMWEYKEVGDGQKIRSRFFVVKNKVELTGDDINDANVGRNQYNEPYVSMEFKPKGGKLFEELTGENIGKRFAIILDEQVRSAPVIRSKIGGGVASIEMGSSDYQTSLIESQVLSLVLRTGSLPAPVQVEKVRTVGASLGTDAIDAGKKATLYGFIFVLLFMVYRYKRSGLVSIVALAVNILLVFSLLAVAGATLTLPGIAGIALTIGMAVDCNIIIYERIIEERALGKPERSAVGTGFDKAFLAVIDANITTFIAGVVLYTYGTGPIKGFAVTLMIGIMTTLFTGVFLSRTIIDFFTRKATTKRFF
jgi:preprotein translocase subunit SecD